jgi:competence protein ComEC
MQIAFRGWFNPIDTTGSSYGELMRRRGYHGRIYLTPGNLLREAPHVSKTPAWFAQRLHMAAARKLDRLNLSGDSKAVVTAMTIGDRRGITPDLREDYARSGAAHLLSVSGLHVGIVFMLINIVLYLLPSLRRGHLVKNAVCIAAIWLYSMAAGLSPPVVRSAIMFSFAQLALAASSRRSALNIILGSAVVMLAMNPNHAGDMSFLMSYTAVLSIAVFFGPIYRMVSTKYKLVNALTGVLVVGLVASIGNAPLVSYWFGNFSPIGILLNPLVILTGNLIVLIGVFWLLVPGGVLSGAFSFVLDLAARVQNAAVEWAGGQEWAIFTGNIPGWGVFLCYFLLILSAITTHYFHGETPNRLSLSK